MATDLPTHLKSGKDAEDRALQYLQIQGLELQQKNYRCPAGEIDLVMIDPETNGLVFVEVRYRRSAAFGSPAESVDRRKQKKLIASAEHFRLDHHELAGRPCRFDVVSVSGDLRQGPLQWLQNAF